MMPEQVGSHSHFGRQLARNTGLLVGTSVAGQGAFALLFIVMAHTNSPGQLGLATASYGVALILCDAIDFGTSARILRDRAAGTIDDSAVKELFDVRNLIGIAIGSLWIISSHWTDLTVYESLLAAAYTLIRINQMAILSLLQSAEKFGSVSRITVMERFVCLAVGASLLLLGVAAPLAFYAGLCSGALAALILAARYRQFLLIQLFRISAHIPVKFYFAYGRVFALAGLVTDFLMLDTVFVATIAGSRQAGFFAIGARLTGPFGVVASSLGVALTPRVASSSNRSSLRRGLTIVSAISIGATAVVLGCIFVEASHIVNLIFGHMYQPAVAGVRAYALAGIVVAMNQPLCSFLQASGRALEAAVVLGIGVAVNLSLVAWGAAHAGAAGASRGYLFANAVQLILFSALLQFRSMGPSKSPRALPHVPSVIEEGENVIVLDPGAALQEADKE